MPAAVRTPSSTGFRANGEKKTLAELDGLQIQAIAIDCAGPRIRGDGARRQGLPHRAGWEVRSFLRSQSQIHLGPGVRQSGRPAGGHGRSGRRPSRRARWPRQRSLPERRDARAVHGPGCRRQRDSGHRSRRAGRARHSGGRRLRAVPDEQERSHRGGGGQRRFHLCGGRGQQAGTVVRPPPRQPHRRRLRRAVGRAAATPSRPRPLRLPWRPPAAACR